MTPRPAAFAIPGDIATPTGGYRYERRLLEGLRDQGRDVLHLQFGGSFPDPTPADMADAVAQLMALPPERAVILDGFVSATMDPAALARMPGPSVAMVHHPLALESGLDDTRRDRLDRLERENLALISHVLVPSPHTRRIVTEQYGVPAARVTVARPGTDRPTGPRVPADPPLILSVGIQHPRKGHDVLLQALTRLRDFAWTAVIAGDCYDADHGRHLDALLLSLGLGGRVRLTGRVSAAELDRLYSTASVFALATRYEGYGLVFDEALSYGLPIVSCATGAVPDTVPPEAGLLTQPDDPDAFADALARLLTDRAACDRLANAAAAAGLGLPTWADTAATAGAVLDALPGG
ncbi:glycosyltransferase family 4 protein [Roseospira navarrensis]|uniref:Glycosyltransferase n=1 Tax=Roseospira navarrensis TaxID=140058 RepID=A0A7X2D412_9PROT|nr:glycosyltransferase family 4 protein [Roseospira navarrensis]MQX35710.1 glycosyltransferase [Roseospira navarrensis]